MAVQNQHDMAKVAEIAAQVSALDKQLHAASKEAAQINTREGLLGRPVTDYSQVKQLTDMFDPFLQFWTTAAAWKVRCQQGVMCQLSCFKHPACRHRNALQAGSSTCVAYWVYLTTSAVGLSSLAGEPQVMAVRPTGAAGC